MEKQKKRQQLSNTRDKPMYNEIFDFFIGGISDIIYEYSYEYSQCANCNMTATRLMKKLNNSKPNKLVIHHYCMKEAIIIEKTDKIDTLFIYFYDIAEDVEKKQEIDIEYLSTLLTHGIYQYFELDIFNKNIPTIHSKHLIGGCIMYGAYYYPTMINDMIKD